MRSTAIVVLLSEREAGVMTVMPDARADTKPGLGSSAVVSRLGWRSSALPRCESEHSDCPSSSSSAPSEPLIGASSVGFRSLVEHHSSDLFRNVDGAARLRHVSSHRQDTLSSSPARGRGGRPTQQRLGGAAWDVGRARALSRPGPSQSRRVRSAAECEGVLRAADTSGQRGFWRCLDRGLGLLAAGVGGAQRDEGGGEDEDAAGEQRALEARR